MNRRKMAALLVAQAAHVQFGSSITFVVSRRKFTICLHAVDAEPSTEPWWRKAAKAALNGTPVQVLKPGPEFEKLLQEADPENIGQVYLPEQVAMAMQKASSSTPETRH